MHVAIVLLAIGIAGSSAYDSVVEGKLAQGQSLEVSGYKVTYASLTERDTPHAAEVRAHLLVSRNGKDLGTLEAGKNSYKIAGPDPQVSSEVGIRTDYPTGEDLFVIPEQINDDGSVYFRIFVKPLVNLIWLAGHRVPARIGDRALAGRARAASPRRALRRGRQPGQPRPRPVNIALVLGAALAVLCVVLVALPFLREPEPVSDELDELTPERRRRLALAEERDRALAALKELEADHRAGRVNDEDYRASIGPLRREAAEALRALDQPAADGRDPGERLKPLPLCPSGGVGGRGRAAPRPG